MNPKPNTVFLMLPLVAFFYSTIVTAAPAISVTSDSPFDLLGNSSTDVYSNKESNYSQLTDFTTVVKYEPLSIWNVTGNGSETITDIFNTTEFTAFGPNSNSTTIVVMSKLDLSPAGMGYLYRNTNITNSTMNDFFETKSKTNSTVFNHIATAQQLNITLNFTDINSTIYGLEVNSTLINGSTIALQQFNSTAENASNIVTVYDSELNSTVNYSTDAPQQSNSTNNTSINSTVYATTIDLKPEVSNSTETNTFIVAGLQLGSEENSDSDPVSVIFNRKVRNIRGPKVKVPKY